jgi:hypothetical protein
MGNCARRACWLAQAAACRAGVRYSSNMSKSTHSTAVMMNDACPQQRGTSLRLLINHADASSRGGYGKNCKGDEGAGNH